MKTVALLVHGFNVRDEGRSTIGRLQPFFTSRGIDTIVFKTGWMGLIRVYKDNRKHARRLAEAAFNAKKLDQRVIACGHSNGCCIIHIATTEFHAPIDRISYINPALDPERAPGPQVESFDVWYSPSDFPVKLANWLPASDWGNMGSVGYLGEDPRRTNFNKEELDVRSYSHSDFARAEKLVWYGPRIVRRLLIA